MLTNPSHMKHTDNIILRMLSVRPIITIILIIGFIIYYLIPFFIGTTIIFGFFLIFSIMISNTESRSSTTLVDNFIIFITIILFSISVMYKSFSFELYETKLDDIIVKEYMIYKSKKDNLYLYISNNEHIIQHKITISFEQSQKVDKILKIEQTESNSIWDEDGSIDYNFIFKDKE